MKNKTTTRSIVNQQCPSCRSEKMFTDAIFSRNFNKMHKKCPNCSQSFEPEPGFYTGAMYVSYAFQVAIVVAVVVSTKVLDLDRGVGWYIAWIAGINLILFPLIYRLSRSIWIHIFVPFKKQIGIKPEVDS